VACIDDFLAADDLAARFVADDETDPVVGDLAESDRQAGVEKVDVCCQERVFEAAFDRIRMQRNLAVALSGGRAVSVEDETDWFR